MGETPEVLAETCQEARSNGGPAVLTFRAWNPEVESWDDYKGALERAYAPYLAPYLDGHRRTVTAEQTGHDPEPETLDPDGTGP